MLSEENRKKAFGLRDGASEREKLYIMSHYYADSGQFDKGITALELYEQTYPRDSTPANNLSSIYNQLGHTRKCLESAKKRSNSSRTPSVVMSILPSLMRA